MFLESPSILFAEALNDCFTVLVILFILISVVLEITILVALKLIFEMLEPDPDLSMVKLICSNLPN